MKGLFPLFAAVVLFGLPARGDMYQDGSNAKLPVAMTAPPTAVCLDSSGKMVSVAGVCNEGNFGVANPASSWLSSFWPNATINPPTTLNVIATNGGEALLAASRSSDHTGGPPLGLYDTIGLAALGYNNNPSFDGPTGTWGIYVEGDVAAGTTGTTGTIGIEVDVGNQNYLANIAPYAFGPGKLTAGLWDACGGAGFGGGGGTLSCTIALGILPNTQTWTKGIGFAHNALHTGYGIGGQGVAIEMADRQSIRWANSAYDGSGNAGSIPSPGIVAEMWGATSGGLWLDTANFAAALTLQSGATDTYLVLRNIAGGKQWSIGSAGTGSAFSAGKLVFFDTNDGVAPLVLSSASVIINVPIMTSALPNAAGGGGLFVCIDTVGAMYKKATCP